MKKQPEESKRNAEQRLIERNIEEEINDEAKAKSVRRAKKTDLKNATVEENTDNIQTPEQEQSLYESRFEKRETKKYLAN